MALPLLLGYLILGIAILAVALKASPRLQQLWSRLRTRKPMSMEAWSNDVEDTLAHMTSLDMQSGELEVHWSWLMENAPAEYDDKLILAWERLHRVQPALLAHAQKLGRYRPDLGSKAMMSCLDEPVRMDNACPASRVQVMVPQIIPPPPAMPSLPPSSVASVSVTTPSPAEPAEVSAAPIATQRRPFMVITGGHVKPARMKSGT